MTPHAVGVRPLAPGEASRVAELHRAVFPDYESSRLGPGYCRRMVQAYADRADAWVLVARAPGGPITGFVVGAPPAAQREVNAKLLPWGVVGSLRSPSQLFGRVPAGWQRLRRRWAAPASGPSSSVAADPEPVPAAAPAWPPASIRLVLIGVDPAARGQGVADALLAAFADRARRSGHEAADLSVVVGNAAARGAYARNGWQELAVEGDGVAVRCGLDLRAPGSP